MAPGRTLTSSATAPTLEGGLRIGRLSLDARVSPPTLAADLAEIFKQSWQTQRPSRPDGVLTLDAATHADAWPTVGDDALTVSRTERHVRLTTSVADAQLDRAAQPWTFNLRIRQTSLPDLSRRAHLSIVWHRLLLELGAVYLHAAAVTLRGRTHVFLGEKGSGKSTISVALGQAGGTVLSDDHVLIERTDTGFVVSGCETLARLTEDAERSLFVQPLPIAARDFAGTSKKEFPLADYVRAAPFEARPLDAIHFPAVGTVLRRSERTAQATLLELLARTRRSFRPQDAGEVGTLLEFWSALVAQVPAFDLELSTDLTTLAALPRLLDQ